MSNKWILFILNPNAKSTAFLTSSYYLLRNMELYEVIFLEVQWLVFRIQKNIVYLHYSKCPLLQNTKDFNWQHIEKIEPSKDNLSF